MRTIKNYTIKSKNSKEKYSVILWIENEKFLEKSLCTCLHGSFYRFTKENIKKNNWKCKHIKQAIERYKNKEIDNIEKELKKQSGKRKAIYPIFQ
jgi:predicted nucleic acid-binding Zn finger protein